VQVSHGLKRRNLKGGGTVDNYVFGQRVLFCIHLFFVIFALHVCAIFISSVYSYLLFYLLFSLVTFSSGCVFILMPEKANEIRVVPCNAYPGFSLMNIPQHNYQIR